MVGAFMFSLGWYLRLYQDRFGDDQQNPLSLLQNFLTIPIQFSTTALQFANATIEAELPGSGIFPMPLDLQTTAVAARITPRFIGKLWAVIAFITVGSALLLWAGCILWWMLFQRPSMHNPSSFPEIDMIAMSPYDLQANGNTISRVVQEKGLVNASSCAIGKALGRGTGRLIRLGPVDEDATQLDFTFIGN